MNTDDRFRHFFLETTNQTQLSAFLSQSACNILSPFPIGLSTSIGLIVANPAFTGDMSFANSFSRTEYHGTVVWSWQLAMMGAGLAKQLKRCTSTKKMAVPEFCGDEDCMARCGTRTTASGIPLKRTAISWVRKCGAGSMRMGFSSLWGWGA
jgi:hypothetical protein